MLVNKLFALLVTFVFADCALTIVGVGFMGLIEPNPLYEMCGGIWGFMIMKVVVSAGCLWALHMLYDSKPKVANVLIAFLCGLYAVVAIGGAALIAWEMI